MTELSRAGRERLAAIRGAGSLSALCDVVGAGDEHEAYFEAKDAWRLLRGRELDAVDDDVEADRRIPGATVRVGERPVHVHGITHADTTAEREYLRERVQRVLDAGDVVYCEQGIRGLYFRDVPGVCAMDDYRWALRECRRRGLETHVDGDPFDSLTEDVNELASQFREAAFALVDASSDRFGRRFERAVGTVASEFFRSHADHATGSDFASFRLRERAAEDPSALWRLQRYYECAFLPQPLEREWLRRHDPELELVTHARNARMADYVVHHADGTTSSGSSGQSGDSERGDSSEGGSEPAAGRSGFGDVHLVVGAAHQPGVRYYLERYRDGDRTVGPFDVVLG
ncbi:hypothetical protein [Halorubellus sp. PRR65]|uniref:hypothetical protein n=1 Tax=Halorubellus sp. PRR65 TaxID=3098148 RepID=UPI002B2566A7|nr:hypothetical protein [Halorubellus sp. PRR65]